MRALNGGRLAGRSEDTIEYLELYYTVLLAVRELGGKPMEQAAVAPG